MKIHYRELNILDKMNDAIQNSKKPIAFFELSKEELNSYYTSFDRMGQTEVTYSYKGVPIRVKE